MEIDVAKIYVVYTINTDYKLAFVSNTHLIALLIYRVLFQIIYGN